MYLPETIEHSGQRILTTAQIAEAYGTTEKRISDNFNANQNRYIEGKHFYYLTGEELKEFLQSGISGVQNKSKIRQIYLWTEKGALLHAKSLNTDKAWEVYDFLVENYFRQKQTLPDMSAMEMIVQIAKNAVETEKRMKAIETTQKTQQERIDNISAAFEINHRTWRQEARNIVNRIVQTTGLQYAKVWKESYEALESRAGCNLKIRLVHRRERMYDTGATTTQIKNITNLDVIAEDSRLTEIYISILREMAVKAGV